MNAITRRDLFGLAALAAAGRLPLLGASAASAAVSPIQGYVNTRAPASGSAKPRLLVYDVLRWTQTRPATGETRNIKIGSLEIEEDRGTDGVKLSVWQRTSYSQPVNRLEAEAVCNDDGWLTLRSWRVKSWIEDRDDSLYAASGDIVGARGRVNDGISEHRLYNLSRVTTCQWGIPVGLASGKAIGGGFTLLEDLTLVRPYQMLKKGPEVRVPYRDSEHTLATWAHTGQGVLPIHYLLDASGLPQLMTQGALAWALQRAE